MIPFSPSLLTLLVLVLLSCSWRSIRDNFSGSVISSSSFSLCGCDAFATRKRTTRTGWWRHHPSCAIRSLWRTVSVSASRNEDETIDIPRLLTTPTTSTSNTTKNTTTRTILGVRDCRYDELAECAQLLYDTFEDEEDVSSSVSVLLHEIQQAFPRTTVDRTVYRMLVATMTTIMTPAPPGNAARTTTTTITTTASVVTNPTTGSISSKETKTVRIVGFVDVRFRAHARTDIQNNNNNNRNTNIQQPKPPYLGNLCVHVQYRRRGIAVELVTAVEDFVLQQAYDDTTTTQHRGGWPQQQPQQQQHHQHNRKDERGRPTLIHTVKQSSNSSRRNTTTPRALATAIATTTLFVRVATTNVPALALYRRNGYEQLYTTKTTTVADTEEERLLVFSKGLECSS